jgi:hypothetical protein
MSKESIKRRQFKIKKKREARKKIKKFKEKYFKAKSKEEKEKILDKIKKISSYYLFHKID